ARVPLGDVPVMLQSRLCNLSRLATRDELPHLGECVHDEGGYFVVRGSEKVVIAQERLAANRVYVFRKTPPSRALFVAELRSARDGSFRPAAPHYVRLLAAGADGGGGGGGVTSHGDEAGTLQCALPGVRGDVPLFVVLRALGVEDERALLEHVGVRGGGGAAGGGGAD